MKTVDFIREHDACRDGAKWALSISEDMAVVWDAMIEQKKHAWLLWTLSQPGVFSDSALRHLACRFVRETPLADGGTVWSLLTDERSRKAIEVAEAFANGKATKKELVVAAAAAEAAWASYDAADASAAYAAARAAADVAAWAAAANDANAANAAYYAAIAAYADSCAAASYAANAAYYAARAAYADACAAAIAVAHAAQVRMIAELGNPFKEGACP